MKITWRRWDEVSPRSPWCSIDYNFCKCFLYSKIFFLTCLMSQERCLTNQTQSVIAFYTHVVLFLLFNIFFMTSKVEELNLESIWNIAFWVSSQPYWSSFYNWSQFSDMTKIFLKYSPTFVMTPNFHGHQRQ